MRLLLAATIAVACPLVGGCGGLVLAPVPEVAPTIVLTLNYNGEALTIDLPASPTPTTYGPGYNFTVVGTSVLAGGTTCPDELEFYTNPLGGGGFADICIQGLAPYIDPGVQMFTGSVTNPTFIPGTYNFNVGGRPGVLTIAAKPQVQ